MNAEEAFTSLLEILKGELQTVQNRGAVLFAQGDTPHIHEAADQVEKLKSLFTAVNRLQGEWKLIIPDEKPQAYVQIAPDASPHSAHAPRTQYARTPPGQRTHQDTFWIPILQVLFEMGGKGRTGMILDRVGKKMEETLNDLDRQPLPGGSDIRWRNSAQWARYDMVQSGYLSSSSPNGTWEITDEGRRYLENRMKS